MIPSAIHWTCGRDLPNPTDYGETLTITPWPAGGPTAVCYAPARAARVNRVWVCWFGGAFLGGRPAAMSRVAAWLAARGDVAITADYRLGNPRVGPPAWPGCLADARATVIAARRAFTSSASGDPAVTGSPPRVLGLGHSSGGYLALMVGLTASVATDACDPATTEVTNVPIARQAALDGIASIAAVCDRRGLRTPSQMALLGAPSVGDADLEWRASPLAHVAAQAPPIYTLHGLADTTVPAHHAQTLHEALTHAGARAHQLRLVEAADHDPVTVSELTLLTDWLTAACGESADSRP